jgi:hypothetical protein
MCIKRPYLKNEKTGGWGKRVGVGGRGEKWPKQYTHMWINELKKKKKKKAGGVAESVGPEFKLQYWQKKVINFELVLVAHTYNPSYSETEIRIRFQASSR